MQAKGERRRRKAEPEVPSGALQQLTILYDELLLVSSRVEWAKYTIPIMVAFSFVLFWVGGTLDGILNGLTARLAPSGQPGSADGFSWQLFPAYLIAGVATLAIWLANLNHIRHFRLVLPRRVRRAGLVERLAMGPEALPDIFAYTPFPWRLFLGARPTAFKHTARLLATHLDWYLLPEPRTYFRFRLVYLTCNFMFVLVYLGFAITWFSGVPQFPQLGAGEVNMSILSLSVIVLLQAMSLMLTHEALRLEACAKVLMWEVELRLAGPGGEPEQQRKIAR